MKRALAILGQFLLFLAIFAVGSFLHPFNLHWATTPTPAGTRYFIPDGLLLALGVFLATVLVQTLRKRTCNTTDTVIAFLLAVAAGYVIKLGFITTVN
jgi:xanthine/uracil permease